MAGKQIGSASDDYVKPSALQPSWLQLAGAHGSQYAAVVGLLMLLVASEQWEPYRHALYVGPTSDLELWKYSYPLRPNHVPAWAVPCIAIFSPVVVILAFLLAGRISRVEAHHACLLAVSCVMSTALLTNWIKINVGRPRPHFVSRCWPNGAMPVFTPDRLPKCSEDAINVAEGSKSFPSGHTSWSTSGLGYLTFWLLGKLACFDGQAQPTRFLVALSPLLGTCHAARCTSNTFLSVACQAAQHRWKGGAPVASERAPTLFFPTAGALWIGMSRVQDYWHHVEDVAAGFAIGLLLAFCFYRQIYSDVMGSQAGMLTAELRGPSSRGSLAGSPSKHSVLYSSGEAAEEHFGIGEERV